MPTCRSAYRNCAICSLACSGVDGTALTTHCAVLDDEDSNSGCGEGEGEGVLLSLGIGDGHTVGTGPESGKSDGELGRSIDCSRKGEGIYAKSCGAVETAA